MTPLPAPVGLETIFPSNDLIGQYRRETNSNALHVPVQCQNIWRCTCGRINAGVACTACGIEKTKLLQVTDVNYISKALDERVAAVRAAEEERIAKKRAEAEEKARIQKEQEDAAFASAVAVLESSNQIAELEAAKKKYDSLAERRDTSKKEAYETKIKTLKKRKSRKRNLLIGAVVLLIGLGLFGYFVGYPYYLRQTAEAAVVNHDYERAIIYSDNKYHNALERISTNNTEEMVSLTLQTLKHNEAQCTVWKRLFQRIFNELPLPSHSQLCNILQFSRTIE